MLNKVLRTTATLVLTSSTLVYADNHEIGDDTMMAETDLMLDEDHDDQVH